MTGPRFCVCVPARDEAARLPVLFDALAEQDVAGPVPLALCINNSNDESMVVVERCTDRYSGRLSVRAVHRTLPRSTAHVGTARGIAMEIGAGLVDRDRGVLLSTDADCRPPRSWIGATLAAIDAGADMVGGRIVLDDDGTVSAPIRAMRDRIDAYWHEVRAIEDAVDPRSWDRAPRHGDHTGASLAITATLYRTIGGVPPIASGEDRAMVDNGIAAGGRLCHPVDVWTRTSARRVGRAVGGMAEEMARLETLVARGRPPLLPHFDHWRDRALWRRSHRDQSGGDATIAREERLLPPMPCDMPLA